MKKELLLSIVLATCLLFVPVTSQALTIGFDPMDQVVQVGAPTMVDLTISGLSLLSPDSLGTFDVDIGFDPTILAFSGVTFGDPGLGDQLDIFGLGSITGVDDSIPGSVNLFELSLDFRQDLHALQWDSFTLATLTFDTLAVGTSSLDISINALEDAWGFPLVADLQSGSISAVPEPATILLIGTGLIGLGYFRRKRLT